MKTLELNKMGLVPMTETENREINGGVWWLPAALVTGLLMSAIHNFADILREDVPDALVAAPLAASTNRIAAAAASGNQWRRANLRI